MDVIGTVQEPEMDVIGTVQKAEDILGMPGMVG